MATDDDDDNPDDNFDDVGHYRGDDSGGGDGEGLTTRECRIVQLIAAPGYHAVFAVDHDGHAPSDDEEVPLMLAKRPVHFLAVVNSIYRLHQSEGDLQQGHFTDQDTEHTVGAVEIVAGTVRLVSIATNFAGIMPPGSEMSESVGYLRPDYYDRLDEPDSN